MGCQNINEIEIELIYELGLPISNESSNMDLDGGNAFDNPLLLNSIDGGNAFDNISSLNTIDGGSAFN